MSTTKKKPKQKKDSKGRFTKKSDAKPKPKPEKVKGEDESTLIEEDADESPSYKDDGGTLHNTDSEEVNNNRNTSQRDDKH